MNTLLFGMPGPLELVLLIVIVLIVFGAGKLPQIGDALGKGIRNFKKATSGKDDIDVTPEEPKATELPSASAAMPVTEAQEVSEPVSTTKTAE